jgi:hypothetical protein
VAIRELTLADIEDLPRGTIIADASGAHWSVETVTQEGRMLVPVTADGTLAGSSAMVSSDAVLDYGPFSTLPTVDDIPDEGARNLATRLMLQSAQDNASIASSLAEHWRERAETAETALRLIRARVEALYAGPYAPNESRVIGALYPSDDQVTYARQNGIPE